MQNHKLTEFLEDVTVTMSVSIVINIIKVKNNPKPIMRIVSCYIALLHRVIFALKYTFR